MAKLFVLLGIPLLGLIALFVAIGLLRDMKKGERHSGRPAGVTIFAVLYFILAILLLPDVVKILFAVVKLVPHISAPATGHDPSGFDIFLLSLVNLSARTVPFLSVAMIGIGLLKLSNRVRRFLLLFNCFGILFIASFLVALTQSYRAIQASLFYRTAMIGALILFVVATWFFVRSDIKKVFG